MICPRCGFRQPDDLYCARCGVEVARYVRKRRKRRYRWGVGLMVVIVAAVLGARFFMGEAPPGDRSPQIKEGKAEKALAEGKGGNQIESRRQQAPPVVPAPRPAKEVGRPPAESTKPAAKPDQTETRQAPAAFPPQPEDKQKREGAPKTDEGVQTAADWFDKGKTLNDDSDLEIQYYQKALELDPGLAPAHFRLGAVYYRRGESDLAEHEFARFLKYASDADRVAYNIYLYYTPEYLKGVAEETPAGTPTKEAGKEAVKKAEKPERETKEEAKGLQTIVRFSTSNGHMVVPVLLNDAAEARLVFDTGAEMTVLSRKTAEGLGLRPGGQRPVRLQTIASQIQAPVATLSSLQCGEMRRTNLPVAVVDFDLGREVDGILGMDFLGNYAIGIESESSRIVLKPR
ncbi:MAG TPA: aspartyl protease family protein, partial [Syntrophobacteria bacterium]|nr:aspartyl protease family protein [Syntrophobacteria bacterium]